MLDYIDSRPNDLRSCEVSENVSSTHDAVVEFHQGLSHADKLQTFSRTYDVELNEECPTMDKNPV